MSSVAAIKKLKDDSKKREMLARGSSEKAKKLSLNSRVDRIIEFMNIRNKRFHEKGGR